MRDEEEIRKRLHAYETVVERERSFVSEGLLGDWDDDHRIYAEKDRIVSAVLDNNELAEEVSSRIDELRWVLGDE